MSTVPPGATLTLRFALPAQLALCVGVGRWGPCIHGVRVDVLDGAIVEMRGWDGLESTARSQVFDQAQRFLIAIAGGRARLPALSFPAQLRTLSRPDRAESYSIVTGAAVSITRALERPVVC